MSRPAPWRVSDYTAFWRDVESERDTALRRRGHSSVRQLLANERASWALRCPSTVYVYSNLTAPYADDFAAKRDAAK